MRLFLRLLRRVLGVIGALVLLGVVGLGGLVWLSLSGGEQSVSIPGLSAPVDVAFDQDGVPRIRAATMLDAASALGYVHARDRMFQMEMMRRAASGRLAELFGARALPMDRQMRTLGLARRAAADEAALPADGRAMLAAYARGVNAWIGQRGRFAAPEFIALGAPEPWRPGDSLLWGKTMGLWLSFNWRQELARWRLEGKMPREAILALWPDQHQSGRPDAPVGQSAEADAEAARFAAALPAFPAPFTQPDRASNEWAVDGSHSATGAPLLAGDPHLGFGFPSLWYLARIDTPEGTLAGATSPGVPLMVLGHNGRIAWTFTTTGADVQDVFVETPVGPDQYQTPDGPRPFTVREERIGVRGQRDEVLRVRETRHGPVVSDLMGVQGTILAVQMANLAPGDTAAEGLLALNRAGSVEEAGRAAALITTPVQNLLVADRRSIGLFVTGRVPIRKAGDGAMPVEGADSAHDWAGWAAGDQLPRYVAPTSGVLVNANERVAPPNFPVFLGRDWFSDWRARRIRALLAAPEPKTVEGFTRMQVDVTSEMARQMLPALLSVPAPPGLAGAARALLEGWDGTMAMDRPQPLIFEAWMDRFYAALLRRTGGGTAVAPPPEFLPAALLPGGAHWCGGDCAAMLTQALEDAVADLATRFGDDPAAWRWGAAHEAVFAHPILGQIPLLARLGRIAIPAPGSATTIFAEATGQDGFRAVLGPEFRGVYDLADLDRSRFVIAPGQSGNLFSPRARSFLERWRDGGTVALTPVPEQVSARLHLAP
ncbi:MAG: penicillin acylase family protein [Acetobacteraceae bacterium]|nr:penicillin acylase family protein [Acetobacteraceae bacterium]